LSPTCDARVLLTLHGDVDRLFGSIGPGDAGGHANDNVVRAESALQGMG
jgi:hypothetical protein